jgi:DNA-3-methyladenine glycosylase I
MGQKPRCYWAAGNDLLIEYHDREWGVPVHDDTLLFEFLILEGAQAGLSWTTILNKRNGYRHAYGGFDVEKVAKYDKKDIEKLLNNSDIVRNRLKINASVKNAKAFLSVCNEFGTFDAYIWQFVRQRPKTNSWRQEHDIPAYTPESEAMSKDLKQRGFSFVGSTICYAFMQAVGMVNDHTVTCFRYREILRLYQRGVEA